MTTRSSAKMDNVFADDLVVTERQLGAVMTTDLELRNRSY